MPITISLILLIIALVCFVASALGFASLVAAGLAFTVGAFIADRLQGT